MRTWQSKCAAWRKRAILCKNHRPGNGNTQACVLPRALLGFCTAPRNPLLKRHCGGGNKLVCCQRPHLFSQQLTAQSLVCSQIKHGKELLSQFRTIDCLVRRAAPRKTDNNFCHYIACLVACRSARCFAIGAVIFAFGKRFQDPLLCPTLLFLKVRSSPLYARTYTYIHARTDSFIQEL